MFSVFEHPAPSRNLSTSFFHPKKSSIFIVFYTFTFRSYYITMNNANQYNHLSLNCNFYYISNLLQKILIKKRSKMPFRKRTKSKKAYNKKSSSNTKNKHETTNSPLTNSPLGIPTNRSAPWGASTVILCGSMYSPLLQVQ